MIRVRTDIPHGNAASATCRVEGTIATVRFTAHPHGGTESLWWCMRLERANDDVQEIELVWENCTNSLGIGPQSPALMHPVIRVDGSGWTRLSAGIARETPDGRVEAVWRFLAPEDAADVAFCFPHGPRQLDALARDTDWHRDTIGVSQCGRDLVRLANDYGRENYDRPGVYCLSHQHASEMSGAWALDGFLRRMAERGPEAPLVWAVPFANIDGVVDGDYGKDPFPWDLNRSWGCPPMRHETLTLMRDIQRWRQRCRPALTLDFHSPGGAEDKGAYTFVPDPETDASCRALVDPWLEPICLRLGKFGAPDFARIANYPSRFGDGDKFTRFCMTNHDLPSLTFEIPYHRVGHTVLTVEQYQLIGARIADAVADRCLGLE